MRRKGYLRTSTLLRYAPLLRKYDRREACTVRTLQRNTKNSTIIPVHYVSQEVRTFTVRVRTTYLTTVRVLSVELVRTVGSTVPTVPYRTVP